MVNPTATKNKNLHARLAAGNTQKGACAERAKAAKEGDERDIICHTVGGLLRGERIVVIIMKAIRLAQW